jgi:hypothetical protein
MASSLFGSSLTKELDLRPDQFTYLLDLAATLKRDRKSGTEKPMLTRKTIALLIIKGLQLLYLIRNPPKLDTKNPSQIQR